MEENKTYNEELIIEEENQEQLVPVYETSEPEEIEVFSKGDKLAIAVSAISGLAIAGASLGIYFKKRKEAKIKKEQEAFKNRIIDTMIESGLDEEDINNVLETLDKTTQEKKEDK